eukprot:scaffold47804_cov24-Tisochrysis_lutea.AAC.2
MLSAHACARVCAPVLDCVLTRTCMWALTWTKDTHNAPESSAPADSLQASCKEAFGYATDL